MTTEDIISLVGEQRLYTLHSHTQYCDGRATMAEFAAKASEMGFGVYGFTPHSPLPIPSPCNMSSDSVAEYLSEADRLSALYPDVRFLKGMEVDYLGEEWGPSHPYFSSLGLDYTIGSVHFIPNQEGEYYDIDGRPQVFQGRLQEHFHGDLRYVVDTFFEQSLKMVQAGGFQIIGHFDKVKLNAGTVCPELEATDWYRAHVNELIDAIMASNLIVEVNTKSWQEFRHMFPAQHHWRTLLKAGVPIVVNSDAHFTDRINAGRMEALKALDYLKAHL